MAKENNSDDFLKMLNDLSESVNDINRSVDGKIIIEENQFVDSSVPMDLNRLSPNKDAAMNESDYLSARKKNKLSKKHIKRIARDYIEEKSNGIIKVDPGE